RAPAKIAGPRVPPVALSDRLEAACRVKLRSHFLGQPLKLDEAVLASRLNGRFVQARRIDVTPFEARNLGRDEGVLVGERRRVGFSPLAQLFPVRRQDVAPPSLLVRR